LVGLRELCGEFVSRRIAFDIDDTITRCPQFFAVISKALRAAGHKVYVISYREDREFAEQDLADYGVLYDELALPSQAEMHSAPPGEWKNAAARWKADVCRRLAIDVFFEDVPEVVNAMGGGTVAFMAVDSTLGKVGYVKSISSG